MPLEILHGDITKFACDAIVNAANESLLGGGGVDGAIHLAAGPELLAECRALGGCRTGEAKRTGGYRLPCRYVIHTVGPVYIDGLQGEPELLAACYRNSMRLAAQSGCRSIAFPLISAGAYGYPTAEELRIAIETLQAAPETANMRVALLLYESRDQAQAARRRAALAAQLEAMRARGMNTQEIFVSLPMQQNAMPSRPAQKAEKKRLFRRRKAEEAAAESDDLFSESAEKSEEAGSGSIASSVFNAFDTERELMPPAPALAPHAMPSIDADADANDLEAMLRHLDAGFSETLFRLIDARGMTDAECYKKAGIDRRLFSKIRSDPSYRPSKSTVLALAIALELSEQETADLLRRAGFALSPSKAFDVIILYYIRLGVYDLFEINETLFSFDQSLLGA